MNVNVKTYEVTVIDLTDSGEPSPAETAILQAVEEGLRLQGFTVAEVTVIER